MQILLQNEPVPVKSWSPKPLSGEEMATATHMARAPFAYHHVALMPDVHQGSGILVGSVFPTRDAIMPAAIGGDIGCGMSAAKLPIHANVLGKKPKVLERVREKIGRIAAIEHGKHTEIGEDVLSWRGWETFPALHPRLQGEKDTALRQLGTLGGGNHFIEVSVDDNDGDNPHLWVVLHTGSRNLGTAVRDIHFESARAYTASSGIAVPNSMLSFLRQGTAEFAEFWRDLEWAQSYAMTNRDILMNRILALLSDMFNQGEPLDALERINCHHNYAALEEHFGERVFVTRKGAIRADVGDLGIIPGSMGTSTYLVRGKGHPESFRSSSHGAGRKMSRAKAKEKFGPQDLRKQTQGIVCDTSARMAEEAPLAYKPIEDVMAAQADLVETVRILRQLINVKGY